MTRLAPAALLALLTAACGTENTESAEADAGAPEGDTLGSDVGVAHDTDLLDDIAVSDDTTTGIDTALTDSSVSDTEVARDAGGNDRGIPCDVATVLDENCVSCHGVEPIYGAPMPLVSRADLAAPSLSQPAKSVFKLSLERIGDDRNPMPPAPHDRLSESEIATLTAWFDAGAPAGEACVDEPDVIEADAGTDIVDSGGIDDVVSDTSPDTVLDVAPDVTPDVVVEPECEWEVEFLANNGGGEGDTTPFTVPNRANHYECFYFSPSWETDAHGLKFSAMIDDERVVHHWLLYAETGAGTPGTRRSCSGSHEDATLIAGWAPGGDDWVMPAGVGMQLPADTTYFVEIHYANPRNLATTDRSGVRVCGTNTLREHTAGTHWLGTEAIVLFGAGEHETTGTCTPEIDQPAHILRSWPHMHRNGVGMYSEIIRAGGEREVMLDVPFSFDNQISHATEFTIYPGDQIVTTCEYLTDTSFVTFGADTEQEMCYNFVVAWPVGAFNTGGGVRGGTDNFCLR